MIIEEVAYARAGLVGNPSDGYFGKTISIIVRNFTAKVSLYESPQLELVPSFEDRLKFDSIQDLVQDVSRVGYYGGVRLVKATFKKFAEYCDQHGIQLSGRNCTVRYRSTIPRQVGLAGSSALVTATLRCILDFYNISIPKPAQANLLLSVENDELGISAGLQDRVIQVYEGAVSMDFDHSTMEEQGHGDYEELDTSLLPPLFIAYRTDVAESSAVFHNNVRERWNQGDPEVIEAMEACAECARQARDLIVAGRGSEIGPLLNENFARRRSMYELDPKDLLMVETAQKLGCGCKFAGSGGAVVGVFDSEDTYHALDQAYKDMRIVMIRPLITPG